MPRYAIGSKTSVMLTQREIQRMAKRYKSTDLHFAEGVDLLQAAVKTATGLRLLITVPLPKMPERGSVDFYEQRRRECWRTLALMIKAALVSEDCSARVVGST